MKKIATAAAALVAASVLPAAPVHADPTFMNQTEFNTVAEGQTKGKVEATCACIGQNTGWTVPHNGNTYTAWQYLTHVGWAYIFYRNASDGTKRVGYEKDWCVAPAGDQGIPDGSCSKWSFS